MKKITIVGGGEIGSFVAERLAAEKYDVTVIDHNPEVLSELQNNLDIGVIQGNATNLQDLRDAEIEDSDLFIATTRQDETNLIACLLSKELSIPSNIAITRYLGSKGHKHGQQQRLMGIDLVVNTSEVVKNEIMDVIETTGASEVATFAEGRIVLIGYRVGPESALLGRTLEDLKQNGNGADFHLGCLVREHQMIPPTIETQLVLDDFLYLITTQEALPLVNKLLQVETIKSRTAVIYGDNYLSQLLAQSLLNRHFHVTMLASSEARAEVLRTYFQNKRHFLVETGEGVEIKLLRRVKVPTTSVFIAAKSDDPSNLTACMIAKDLGVGKTVATIKSTDMLALASTAGVDVSVAPRIATVKTIQKVVHGNHMLDYRAVYQTNLEVIELKAQKGCKASKTMLDKVKLPEGVAIGGIVSKGEAFLPDKNRKIIAGDSVIVLTLPEHMVEVEKLFCE